VVVGGAAAAGGAYYYRKKKGKGKVHKDQLNLLTCYYQINCISQNELIYLSFWPFLPNDFV